MPKPCWMPGASCFKTKPLNIKFIAFTNPMSVVFPKAKPIKLLNSAAKSRSPEPVTVELFWEPWHCLEIPTMATRFKTPLSKSKESLENSRKSSSQTGVTKAKRNLAKPVCWLLQSLKKTDSQYDQRKQRKRFRKRAGLEATISHLKQHFRMGKCYLKGELGDQINVILAAAAYNLRRWIRLRLDSFFFTVFKDSQFSY